MTHSPIHEILFLPGNAIKPRTAVTAVTSCAVAVATTPTWTKWSSVATASTTGAVTSPARNASGLSRDTCANEGAFAGLSSRLGP